MPTAGDNIICINREVLVASLMYIFPLNFGEIIADEMKFWPTRPDVSYPFPCLILTFCQVVYVLKIIDLDKEVIARKTHNPFKFDESQPMLVLGNGEEVESDIIMYDRV